MNEFVRNDILHLIYPGALEAIQEHRSKSIPLVIATGAIDLYAEPIGHILGFDAVISTETQFINGRFTELLRADPCLGDKKERSG